MRRFGTYFFVVSMFCALAVPQVQAQELRTETQQSYRAKVMDVVSEDVRLVPGTDTEHRYQTIRAEILEGPQEGEEVTIENDYLALKEGDRFYLSHTTLLDGSEVYGVLSIDRTSSLLWLAVFFAAVVIAFGGWQGVRSLIALAGSLAAIVYILMPGLLAGFSPILTSVGVAAVVLCVAIFFTHGFNRESLVAYAGTMVAVCATGLFALVAVSWASLSGFAAEESVYLNINTQGTLDFTGLLLGAIIIGVLGVLDDIAITQAAVVGELYSSRPDMGKLEAYHRALRVGREHVGALINTLALAYTGAALPLLLLLYTTEADLRSIVNMEVFATEIVRTIVGSFGLVLTVPLVTALAAWFLHGRTHRSGHHHAHH